MLWVRCGYSCTTCPRPQALHGHHACLPPHTHTTAATAPVANLLNPVDPIHTTNCRVPATHGTTAAASTTATMDPNQAMRGGAYSHWGHTHNSQVTPTSQVCSCFVYCHHCSNRTSNPKSRRHSLLPLKEPLLLQPLQPPIGTATGRQLVSLVPHSWW